jgi:ferritin-like metal-binding protein YciE
MTLGQDKLIQALQNALATELALAQTLRAHAGLAPRSSYRQLLEGHLEETHNHADWVGKRLEELGAQRRTVDVAADVAKTLVGPAFSMAKTPFDLIRGGSVEDKLLENIEEACGAEAFEIASYRAIEAMANDLGDSETVQLAQTIVEQEERALSGFQDELPRLVRDVMASEIQGRSRFDISTTGAADAVRSFQEGFGHATRRVERRAERAAHQAAREARKVPGVARAEGQVRGSLASPEDLAIADYDSLNAQQVIAKLDGLSGRELSEVAAYERRNHNRRTVLTRIDALQAQEPWPGYSELSVSDIEAVLSEADRERIARVRDYEPRYKNRSRIIEATERQLQHK